MHMQIQDIANQLALLKQQFESFAPALEDDGNLSTLVASLQSDVNTCKSNISSLQSSLASINNTYTQLVANVENNTTNINNLLAKDDELSMEIANLNVRCDNTQNIAINTQSALHTINNSLSNHIDQTSSHAASIEALQNETAQLQQSIETIQQGTTCDNEFYFIVKGTYASPDEVNKVIDGTY